MNSTEQKLLGITLALVMLAGSVPLSFADDPLTQPSHAVLRDMTMPDLTKTQKPVLFPSNTHGETKEGLVTAKFSSLPRLNEAVTVTVYYTDPYRDTPLSLGNELYVSIDDGWEFVNPPADKLTIVEENGTRPGSSMIDEPLAAAQGETKSLSVQVKPVKEGNLFISAGLAWGESKGFRLFVGEDRTISYDQYLRENPDIAAAMLAREIAENKALANSDPISSIIPHLGKILKEQGYSEEEIEKISVTTKNQISDGVGATISATGTVTNSPSPYSESSVTGVHDIQVCAWDSDQPSFELLGCDYTDSDGDYDISGIVNSDEDGTGLDIFITFSTNSEHSKTRDSNSAYYLDWVDVGDDVPDEDIQTDYSPASTGTLDETKYHRAFWITDSIADGHKFFADQNSDVVFVNVNWQHDSGSSIFGDSTNNGAYYRPVSETLYLDGFSTVPPRDDDSPERQTILHEWGHHYMNKVFSGMPGSCYGSHSIRVVNTEACAWTEGWSGIVASLVDNESRYAKNADTVYDFEEGWYTYQGNHRPFNGIRNGYDVGHQIEGYVAGVLWDIYDGTGTATYDQRDSQDKDDLDEGADDIVAVLAQRPESFMQFYETWKNDYTTDQEIEDVMYLHHMGFVSPLDSFDDDFETDLNNWARNGDVDHNWHQNKTDVDFGGKNHLTNDVAVASECNPQCVLTLIPYMDLTSYANPELHLWRFIDSDIVDTEGLAIRTSVDGGATWNHLAWWGSSDGDDTWTHESIDLSSYQGSDTFKIRFIANSDTSLTKVLQIDDVEIVESASNAAPVLDAIGDFDIPEDSTLTFTATATDADNGDTLTFSLADGSSGTVPTGATINSATGAFSWPLSGYQNGRFVFDVVVTDDGSPNLDDSETITVTTYDPDSRSSPRKVSNLTVPVVTSSSVLVNWDAPSSIAAKAIPSPTEYDLQRQKTFYPGYSTIATVLAGTTSYSDDDVSVDTSYDYKVRAKNDNGYGEFSDPATAVTPSSSNAPPEVRMDVPSEVEEGTLGILDGSRSYDPDGDPITFFWNQTDSSGTTVTLSSPTSAVTTFTAPLVPANTTLTFQLDVDDGTATESGTESLKLVDVPMNQANLPRIPYPFTSIGTTFGTSVAVNDAGTVLAVGAPLQDLAELPFAVADGNDASPLSSETKTRTYAVSVDDQTNTVNFADLQTGDTVYSAAQYVFDSAWILDDDSNVRIITSNGTKTVQILPSAMENSYIKEDAGSGLMNLYGSSGNLIATVPEYDDDDNNYNYNYNNNSDNNKYVVLTAEQTGQRFVFDASTGIMASSSADAAGVMIILNANDGTVRTSIPNPYPGDGDKFGSSVAFVDSDKIVIGAYSDHVPPYTDAGQAFIYNVDGTKIADLTAQTVTNNDEFGYDVASDGSKIVVGAPEAPGGGTATVFDTSGSRLQTISNPSGNSGDDFGATVAISDSYVIVGAHGDDAVASSAGTVYVFDKSSYVQQRQLTHANHGSWDYFGRSVDSDGDLILVGASGDGKAGYASGSAYVFDGTTGTLQSGANDLVNPDPDSGDLFGYAVVFAGDYLAVGAYKDDNSASDAGALYVFNATDYSHMASLENPEAYSGEYGISLSGSDSQNAVFVGAPDNGNSGVSYLYTETDMFPPNVIPVAFAGANQTVTEQTTVTLDGSSSYDGDGDPITYMWSQTDSSGYAITLSDSSSASPTFAAPDVSAPTDLTFDLTVNDGTDDSVPDGVTVTVEPITITTPNMVITHPANNTVFAENQMANFTGVAYDAEDGIISSLTNWYSDVDGFLGTGNATSTSALSLGNHTITANVTDSSSRVGSDYAAIMIDAIPVITLLGNDTEYVELNLQNYTDAGATASDVENGNLTNYIITNNPVDESVLGTYTVTYDVTDFNNADAVQKYRTVVVEDTTPPVITLNGSNPQVIRINSVYTELGANVTDNDAAYSETISINAAAVDTDVAGNYTVTYDASPDTSGNHVTQATRTVTVHDDTTPPVITLNGENPQTIKVGSGYVELGATTDDGSAVTIDSSEFTDVIGDYSIYYDSVDPFENHAVQVIRTVNVVHAGTEVFRIVTSSTDNSVTLDWEDPEGEGDDINGYKIRYKQTGKSHNKYLGQTFVNTVATVHGLNTDTRYDITLTALYNNDTKKSETVTALASSTKSLSINDTTPPSVPSSITTSSTDTSVTLDWDMPPDELEEIIGYKVRYKHTGKSHWYYSGQLFPDTIATIHGLKTDTRYDFVVTSVNDFGKTASGIVTELASSTKQLSINDTTPPSVPSSITTSSTDTSVTLDWDMPPDELEEIIGYKVRYKHTGKSHWYYSGQLFPDTIATIHGLKTDTRYDFVVTSVNDFGKTASGIVTALASSTHELKINDTTLPSKPFDISATSSADNSIILQWDVPENEKGEITGYRIQYKPTDQSHWWHIGHTYAGDATATISGLKSGTSYDFVIMSANDYGHSASDMITATAGSGLHDDDDTQQQQPQQQPPLITTSNSTDTITDNDDDTQQQPQQQPLITTSNSTDTTADNDDDTQQQPQQQPLITTSNSTDTTADNDDDTQQQPPLITTNPTVDTPEPVTDEHITKKTKKEKSTSTSVKYANDRSVSSASTRQQQTTTTPDTQQQQQTTTTTPDTQQQQQTTTTTPDTQQQQTTTRSILDKEQETATEQKVTPKLGGGDSNTEQKQTEAEPDIVDPESAINNNLQPKPNPEPTCGSGTIEVDGVCQAVQQQQQPEPTCGLGTETVNGFCQVIRTTTPVTATTTDKPDETNPQAASNNLHDILNERFMGFWDMLMMNR